MENWCQEIVEELEAKKRDGYTWTEDEAESYYYAKNVLQSEDAERAYLNGDK